MLESIGGFRHHQPTHAGFRQCRKRFVEVFGTWTLHHHQLKPQQTEPLFSGPYQRSERWVSAVRKKHAHSRQARRGLLEECQPFAGQVDVNILHSSDISIRLGQIRHHARSLKITTIRTYRYRLGHALYLLRGPCARDQEDVDVELHQLLSKAWNLIRVSSGVSAFHHDVLPLDPAEISHGFPEQASTRATHWRIRKVDDADFGNFPFRLRLGGKRRGEEASTQSGEECSPIHRAPSSNFLRAVS